MAEAFARIHGKGIVNAYSSGSNPAGTVNEKAINSMRRTGYDLSTHISKPLSKLPNIEFDILISMGCNDTCPSIKAKQRLEWNIVDPKSFDDRKFDGVRTRIEKEVKSLLEQLSQ